MGLAGQDWNNKIKKNNAAIMRFLLAISGEDYEDKKNNMKAMHYNNDYFFGWAISVGLALLGKIFNLMLLGVLSNAASLASLTLSVVMIIINWQKFISAIKTNYYKLKNHLKRKK